MHTDQRYSIQYTYKLSTVHILNLRKYAERQNVNFPSWEFRSYTHVEVMCMKV